MDILCNSAMVTCDTWFVCGSEHCRMNNSEEVHSKPRSLRLRWMYSDVVESLGFSAVIVCAFLLTQWRYGFDWSDEGWLWYVSQRTALGQIPLRDFFSYDPGRYYWSAMFFKILGGNGLFEQIVANDAFAFLGLVVAYLAMSRSGLGRGWRIAILLLLGIMFGYPRHKIYEQSLSLVAAACIAVLLARPARMRLWFFYGVASGLAAFIGRNSGLYFAVAGLLTLLALQITGWKVPAGRALGSLLAGIVIGYLPMFCMLAFVSGFAWAFYQSVLFTPHWQLPLPIPWPWRVDVKSLHGANLVYAEAVGILCLAVPLSYCGVLLEWLRSKGKVVGARRLACAAAIAGIPYLHHAFSRAGFPHIAQGILPFGVAIGAFCEFYWMVHRRRLALAVFVPVTGLLLACWIPREPFVQFLRTKTIGPHRAEEMQIGGKTFEVAWPEAEILHATEGEFRRCRAGDGRLLAAPYYPGIYAFIGTRAPFWELYYLYPRSVEFQHRHIEALEKNGTAIVIWNREVMIDGLSRLQIGNTNPELAEYLHSHYQPSEIRLPEGFEIRDLPQDCLGPAHESNSK